MAPSVGGVSSTSVCGVQTTSKLIHKLTPWKQGRCMCIRWLFKPLHVMFRVTEAAFFCFVLGFAFFWMRVLWYVDETFFVFQTYLKMMDTKKGWLEGAKLLNKTVGFSSQICETSSLFVEGGFFFEAFLETRQTFPKKKIGTRWVGALISERIDFKNPWIVRVNYVYYGELYSSTSFVWGIRELYSSTFIYD